MLAYFFKRILLFIPSIILIGAFTFFLFHASPTDPIESLLRVEGFEKDVISDDQYRSQYKRLAAELKLDQPKFYFGIVPNYYPDTLYKIIDKQERKRLVELLGHHNDWKAVNTFFYSGKRILSESKNKTSARLINELLYVKDPIDFKSSLESIKNDSITTVESSFYDITQMLSEENKRVFALPKLLWFGANNQFHSWLTNFFTGTLGRSIIDGRPVWSKISKALIWTLFLVLVALLLAIVISIPIGVWSASNVSSRLSKFSQSFFYFIYAMPLFWFATLMVVFFTTSQYGNWTNIFPGVGISSFSKDPSTLGKIAANAKQLILPIFCMALHSVAFLSSIVRNSVIAESKKAYKITAHLKGLTNKATFWKHLFPNSLLPLVTIIVGAIPASLSGSLVIEVIFNIPGVGRLLFDSIFGNDWYVIFSIVMIVGLVTIISYLIGDLLYSFLNPKIRFGQTKKV